jgi:hypothetical protein
MTWTTPNTAEAGQPISASDYNVYVRDNLAHLYGELPTRATLWHDEATVVAGNAIAITFNTSQLYNALHNQNPAADGGAFTQTVVLAEGTYSFYALGRTGSGLGRLDWYIDDVKVISAQDWYAASITYNVIQTATDIVIAEGGRHVLKGVVNGKHVSSTGYAIYLTKYWFKQASDA